MKNVPRQIPRPRKHVYGETPVLRTTSNSADWIRFRQCRLHSSYVMLCLNESVVSEPVCKRRKMMSIWAENLEEILLVDSILNAVLFHLSLKHWFPLGQVSKKLKHAVEAKMLHLKSIDFTDLLPWIKPGQSYWFNHRAHKVVDGLKFFARRAPNICIFRGLLGPELQWAYASCHWHCSILINLGSFKALSSLNLQAFWMVENQAGLAFGLLERIGWSLKELVFFSLDKVANISECIPVLKKIFGNLHNLRSLDFILNPNYQFLLMDLPNPRALRRLRICQLTTPFGESFLGRCLFLEQLIVEISCFSGFSLFKLRNLKQIHLGKHFQMDNPRDFANFLRRSKRLRKVTIDGQFEVSSQLLLQLSNQRHLRTLKIPATHHLTTWWLPAYVHLTCLQLTRVSSQDVIQKVNLMQNLSKLSIQCDEPLVLKLQLANLQHLCLTSSAFVELTVQKPCGQFIESLELDANAVLMENLYSGLVCRVPNLVKLKVNFELGTEDDLFFDILKLFSRYCMKFSVVRSSYEAMTELDLDWRFPDLYFTCSEDDFCF